MLAAGQALTDDPCSSSPCQNGGVCIQVRYGRFRCECTGTGFYGDNCAKGEMDTAFLGFPFMTSIKLYQTITDISLSNFRVPAARWPQRLWH